MQRLILIFAILLALPFAADAQAKSATLWPLDPGSRIRFVSSSSSERSQMGTVVSATHDTLVFQSSHSSPRSVGTNQITQLEMASGTHSSKLKDAFIGFVVGGGAGAIVGLAAFQPKPGDFFYNSPGEAKKMGAFVGALLGGIVGTVTGAVYGAQQRDTWISIAIPRF